MTACVFTPDGIVMSTYAYDTYYQMTKRGDEEYVEKVNILGHPHIVTFWNQYALVFHQADEFSYNSGIKTLIEDVMRKWTDEIPPIYELMPYIKKQLIDNSIQIIGLMSGYSKTSERNLEPHVYQILGNDIRRINIDRSGRISYNCVFLEKNTIFGRLLRDVKIKNGDTWESLPPVQLRCDLYSIAKAKEITSLILKTCYRINNINNYDSDIFDIETVIITPYNMNIE